MIRVKDVLDRARPLAVAGAFIAVIGLSAVPWQSASGAAILNRSLEVTSTQPSDSPVDGAGNDVSAEPGHPQNGTQVGHRYTFTAGSAHANLQGIQFSAWDSAFGFLNSAGEYGGTPTGAVPTGFSSAAISTTSVDVTIGATTVAFTASSVSAGVWYITSATGIAVSANDVVTVEFGNYFVNPTSAYEDDAGFTGVHATYFVHLQTFDSNSGTWDLNADTIDSGTVTSSVNDSIQITTKVQETLRFSVEGATLSGGTPWAEPGSGVNLPTGIPEPTTADTYCAPLTSLTSIFMGDSNNALAADTSYHAASYFRLATNSTNGARVFYSGETLTSGGNFITAIGDTATTSGFGDEQFGLAIDDTTVGHNALSALVPETAYAGLDAGSNQFAFEAFADAGAPVLLAASPGVVQCDTGAVRYVANISNDTEAGIYTTRINYIASPSY